MGGTVVVMRMPEKVPEIPPKLVGWPAIFRLLTPELRKDDVYPDLDFVGEQLRESLR